MELVKGSMVDDLHLPSEFFVFRMCPVMMANERNCKMSLIRDIWVIGIEL